MDEVRYDSVHGPMVSLDDAAWLARTTRQNVSNWLPKSLKEPPGGGKRYVSLTDLATSLADHRRPAHLDVSWLDVTADDPPLPACRDAVIRLSAITGSGITSDHKASDAAHQQALAEAWARERATARERDEAKAEAEGYASALRALMEKDERVRELRAGAGPA